MTGRLRVVQVVCSDAFAGVERHVATLANGLSEAGCEVLVMGGDPARMPTALEGSDAIFLPVARLHEGIRQLGRQRRLDVVHAHMTEAEVAAVLTRPWHGASVVATLHFARKRGSHVLSRLGAPLLRSALAAEIAVSETVARAAGGQPVVVPAGVAGLRAVGAGCAGDPVAGAYQAAGDAAPPGGNGLDTVVDAGVLPAPPPTVLVVQRLEKEKDTATALRAWAASGLAGKGWRLEIVGAGAERGSLRQLSDELGVAASCCWVGSVTDVADRYRRAALLLAPTPAEGFGLAVVEAMAAGLPVVAAAAGAHLETVGLADGAALFPPGDAPMAGRLLASLAGDPAGRRSYGRRLAHLARERFRVELQVERTLSVYCALVRR